MPTARKPKADTDQPTEAAAEAAAAPNKTGDAEASYRDQATQIGADARALAEATNRELADLAARCAELAQVDPGADVAVADHLRRVPMALDDAAHGLNALTGAGADLAAAAQR